MNMTCFNLGSGFILPIPMLHVSHRVIQSVKERNKQRFWTDFGFLVGLVRQQSSIGAF